MLAMLKPYPHGMFDCTQGKGNEGNINDVFACFFTHSITCVFLLYIYIFCVGDNLSISFSLSRCMEVYGNMNNDNERDLCIKEHGTKERSQT